MHFPKSPSVELLLDGTIFGKESETEDLNTFSSTCLFKAGELGGLMPCRVSQHLLSFLSLYLSLWTSSPEFPPELANPQEILEEVDASNQRVVRALYEALGSRDVETVHRLLAADLEWWFHGPPSHQFMMRLLTGVSSDESFVFQPLAFASFGPTVLAEGCDRSRSISWVHAWTVTDGVITQVREYFNTSLTVTRLSNSDFATSPASSISTASSSTPSPPLRHCPSVWESSFSNQVGKSVPGLVLAI